VFIDLRPYYTRAAITVHRKTIAMKVYKLFRQLGLRSLAVVDDEYKVVGVITRVDLSNFSHNRENKDHSIKDELGKNI